MGGGVVQQLTLDAVTQYHYPLTADERAFLFETWVQLNADSVAWMEQKALELDSRGVRVSTKYLFECVRYETDFKRTPVPFWDRYGKRHEYSVNNSDSATFARWLLRRYPSMRIETRELHSREDLPTADAPRWVCTC